MSLVHILYNPKANQNKGRAAAETLSRRWPAGEATLRDVTEIRDFAKAL